MNKKEVYLIIYRDKDNKIVNSKGKDIKAGSIEFSWYDINEKKKIYIHKDRFISREIIKE